MLLEDNLSHHLFLCLEKERKGMMFEDLCAGHERALKQLALAQTDEVYFLKEEVAKLNTVISDWIEDNDQGIKSNWGGR